MKTKTKASGFFIVEILIVLLIVGILAIALLPNLAMYVKKAKFSDNIGVAAALKPAVEFCMLKNGGSSTSCTGTTTNTEGIPTDVSDYGTDAKNVSSSAVSAGVITVTGTSDVDGKYYTLTPAYNSTNKVITWTVTGDCLQAGLC